MLPSRIPGYRVTESIHQSTATQVVRAIRESDGARVVLKLPTAERPSLSEVARFRHEYELLKLLDGPAVMHVLALEQLEHRHLLVCEDLGAITLEQRFPTRPAIDEFLRVAISIVRALSAVHARGVIHKDINPSNILFVPSSGELKLIDFGIATRLSRESHGVDHPALLEGTLAYISPEQTGRMNCAVDARSDLYSLGATLYALLAGHPPFRCEDPIGYVHAHIALDCPALDAGVPAPVAQIIMKLLAKSVDARYQSARGVLHDLEAVQHYLKHGGALDLGAADSFARFELPHTLYGRAQEVSTLLAAAERAFVGAPELLLVGGYSGIGKSALVSEIQRSIVARRGCFAAGKYDQYNRNVPYLAVSAAFRELTQYLLMEPPARVAQRREQILAAIGGNGRVLVDVVPALELLIGPQQPVPQVPPIEAKNRFDECFRAFVSVLARPEHPLVLFFDDLQWADTPSLHLLETLLVRTAADQADQHCALFIIGAYRDNEVSAAHPAMLMAEQVRKAQTPVTKLELGPLARADTLALVAEALHVGPDTAEPLAELLHGRTGGNPFFLVQLLQSLVHDGLIHPSAADGTWSWDIGQLRARGLTDNVIELMASRLRKVPDASRELLKLAACVGNTFDLQLVATLLGRPERESEALLWPALAEELVVPATAGYRQGPEPRTTYRFLHDRVQQAAYALLDEPTRKAVHLRIGWLLLALTPEARLDAEIFDVIAHLNLGLELVSDPKQREQIARLNVRAGGRARGASAHAAAAENFAIAMSLLGPQIWERDYGLAFQMYRERADSEYISGNFEASDALAIEAIAHCRSSFDTALLYSIRIYMSITQGNFAKATALGLDVLRLFGHDVPADPAGQAQAAASQALQLEAALSGIDIASLYDRPEMTGQAKRTLMMILTDVWCATYFSGNTALNGFSVDLMVCLSLADGYTSESAFAFTVLGMNLNARGQARRAYDFASLGIRLNERLPNPVVTVRAGNMFAHCINPYFNHLETNLPFYRRSYEIGPRVGELIYTVWAVLFMLLLKTTKGDPLAEVFEDATGYLDFVRRTNDQAILNTYTIQLQMIRALRGLTAGRDTLDEGEFSERAALARQYETKFWPGVLFYGAYRSGVHVVFRDFPAALQASKLAEEALPSDIGVWSTTNHFFYQSLALAGLYADAAPAEQPNMLAKLEANHKKLAGWAETGPANFAHRRDLVGAEIARCKGDGDSAARLYDASLDAATAGHFTNDAALAAEAASYFHRARGSSRAAQAYLSEARYAYMRWGATAKVAELDLITTSSDRVAPAGTLDLSSTVTLYGAGDALDLASASKAAQALSGEIDRRALIDKLLRFAMENAGARSVWLILNESDSLQVAARASVDVGGVELTSPVALEAASDLPTAIVQYVARTGEPQVLRDASRSGRFRNESQVVARGTRSVACVPLLRQGRLTGVLHLENDLVEGAFTASRVEPLQLLAAQAAISLENAALYASLEARVADRTRELDAQNAHMRTVLENVEQGFLLAQPSGVLELQHSSILDRWFGAPSPGMLLWDYLGGQVPDMSLTIPVAWQQLFEGLLPVELCMEQMPASFARDGNTYELAWRPILGAGERIERVVVVVTDITSKLSAERAEAQRQELADVLDYALSDRVGFREFSAEARRLIAEMQGPREEAMRAIHTLKGSCMLMRMRSVVAACHQVEDQLTEPSTPVRPAHIESIQRAWQGVAGRLEDVFAKASGEIGVRERDYRALCEALAARKPHPEIAALVARWTKEPLAERFARLGASAQVLARRLGKGEISVRIDAQELRAASEQLAELWASFSHLIRNAIDHGIDTPEARRSAGKPESPCLSFRARCEPHAVLIELADDGGGIDWKKLAQKAALAGLAANSSSDLQEALFADHVSTRDIANDNAGRGVGLAAVRATVRKLGGTITASSTTGAGTCFSIQLPRRLFDAGNATLAA